MHQPNVGTIRSRKDTWKEMQTNLKRVNERMRYGDLKSQVEIDLKREIECE